MRQTNDPETTGSTGRGALEEASWEDCMIGLARWALSRLNLRGQSSSADM